MAALSLATPAVAFDPTPEIATPAEAFRFGYDAYRAGDLVTAMDAIGYAAEQGHLRARWLLARMYAKGEGFERDDGRAFEIFAAIVNEHADDRRFNVDTPFVANAFVALGDYFRAGGQAVGGGDVLQDTVESGAGRLGDVGKDDGVIREPHDRHKLGVRAYVLDRDFGPVVAGPRGRRAASFD